MSKREKTGNKIVLKVVIVAVFLVAVIFSLTIAKNYLRDDIKNQTNLIINNSNVTSSLKHPVYKEDGVIYLSKPDIENFFDPYIYYDEKYNQIITGSSTKIATIPMEGTQIQVNSATQKVKAVARKENDIYYIPFSELESIYQVKVSYKEEADNFVIDSLNRDYSIVTAGKNFSVKYKPTVLSRTVEKGKAGESLVVAERSDYPVPDGWMRVRTQNGTLGYVKTKSVGEKNVLRQAIEHEKKVEGKVSLVWDSYSEYASAPNRTGTTIKGINVVSPSFFTLERLGKGNVKTNIGNAGKEYITWAKSQGYQVWPMISNESMIQTTSEIMNDYKLREKLINSIVNYIVEYQLDGINIDFENMYAEDKNLFSRFLIELEPRLNEIGAVLSVDVTAPDGSDTWSMCFDRHTISKVADYIMFMGYDQYDAEQVGTTAGCDWVEANVSKFLGQEGVASDKLVLGIPFYTKLWKTTNGKTTSGVADLKNIDTILPKEVERKWDENLKQYYVEYEKDGTSYKMWIEDKTSLEAKLNLVEKYNLAGAAYWEKERESDDVWELVSSKLGIE